MALTAIDKVKVAKYLNANAISNLCYLDLCDALGKRGKIRDVEFLDHIYHITNLSMFHLNIYLKLFLVLMFF